MSYICTSVTVGDKVRFIGRGVKVIIFPPSDMPTVEMTHAKNC